MADLPGWAYSGASLPPWYGEGGARGPGGPSTQPLNPGGLASQTIRNTRVGAPRSMGAALDKGTPIFPQQKPGAKPNTAPTNPWVDPRQNQPIYGNDFSAEQGILDKLAAQIQGLQGNAQSDLQKRLDEIGKGGPIERAQYKEQKYSRTGDFGDAMAMAKKLAETGGFSDADLAAMRARGASPIRAVYSAANQKLARQKSLQGGYSPGYSTAVGRMAREQADLAQDAMQKVNADIAEKIAAGKKSGLERYGIMAGDENTLIQDILKGNVTREGEVSRANALAANEAMLQRERERAAAMGQSGELKKGFGDQALQFADLTNRMIQSSRQGRLDERTQSRAGSLNWEELLQRGGQSLIDALMTQYGGK